MRKSFILFFFLYFVTVQAQLNLAEVKKYLTNDGDSSSGDSRIWIVGNYKTNLGQSCTSEGQSWEFYENDKVAVRKCVNGKTVIKEFTYTIKEVKNSPGEYTITFNKPVELISSIPFISMRIYLITPELNTPNKIMKWNNVPECKTCPGEIIEFKSKN